MSSMSFGGQHIIERFSLKKSLTYILKSCLKEMIKIIFKKMKEKGKHQWSTELTCFYTQM